MKVEALAKPLAPGERILQVLAGNGSVDDWSGYVIVTVSEAGVLTITLNRRDPHRGSFTLGDLTSVDAEPAGFTIRSRWWPGGIMEVAFVTVDPARFQEFVQWLQDRMERMKRSFRLANCTGYDDTRLAALRQSGALTKEDFERAKSLVLRHAGYNDTLLVQLERLAAHRRSGRLAEEDFERAKGLLLPR